MQGASRWCFEIIFLKISQKNFVFAIKKSFKMMLENQISSIDNSDYGYEVLDTNLPAIDKLTSATSVSLKYWTSATDDDHTAVLLKNGKHSYYFCLF